MKQYLPRNFDYTNAVVALGVWLTVLVVYAMTKAPTLSFWDCGEFIAANYILGVPHPPGTPLYVLIGRVFSLLPLSADVAVRINLLSSISSSIAALFGYLTAVRIIRYCLQERSSLISRLLIYGGAAAGAFFFAFSLTNWNNSVETEVYGLAMMLFIAILWLALIYRENIDSAFGQRVMLLAFFLTFAGIGVHMTTFLVVPGVALIFLLNKNVPRQTWFIIGAFVLVELYFIFAMSSRPDEIPYYVPVIIVFVFYLFYIFSFEKIPTLYLVTAGGFLLSIVPVAGLISSAEGGSDGLTLLGQVSFIALNLLGLALLGRYIKHRNSAARNEHNLMASIFVLAAGILTAILLLNIRGYTAFLMATALMGLAFVVSQRRYLNWPVLIAVISVSLVILGVKEMVVGLAVATVVVPVVGIVFKRPGWKSAFLILLVAVMGYSVHLFIPIRSARQPVINENNPSQSLDATINFIERKQYGSQSMVERMFKRRAEWGNQLGDHRRMGFWYFFKDQFGLNGIRFIPLFVMGLYGIWEAIRRRPQYGVPLLILILLTSVGLVLYMNFADGTRQHPVTGADYIEVRDRDYFFTPAFILFGLSIGIGFSAVIQFIREALGSGNSKPKQIVVYASMALFLVPSFTVANNYFLSDRSKDYMAYDYAWNILTSAQENAVLITAGDNDTFPLWCLQEAYGVRKDVDVVNLSLANAKWYIKQLKSALGIDLNWTEGQIDSMVVFRDQFGTVHRLQDQVVSRIISENFGDRPINFSFTVPSSGRKFMGQAIDSMLTLQGLVWRLDRTGGTRTIDVEASLELFTNPDKMRFRSIADPSVYKNETAARLTRNYINSFMMVADSLVTARNFDQAELLMKKAVTVVPYSTEGIHYLGALYAEQGKRAELKELIESAEYGDKRWLTTIMGRMEERLGNHEAAENIFASVLEENPSYRPPLEDLLRLYYKARRVEQMKALLGVWLINNPGDLEMKGLRDNIDEQLKKLDSATESNL